MQPTLTIGCPWSPFVDDDSLDDSLLDDILDTLASLSLECIILDRQNLTIEIVSILLETCFHVAKIDEFGYEVPRTANRITIIGVLAVEMNVETVTGKILQVLEEYDKKVKQIVKEYHPRANVEELKKEIEMEDLVVESELSPKHILNDKVTDNGWSKSVILNPPKE